MDMNTLNKRPREKVEVSSMPQAPVLIMSLLRPQVLGERIVPLFPKPRKFVTYHSAIISSLLIL